MSITLATAEKIALKIQGVLEPFCVKIAIAGSIRRRRPQVNDIDLVLIPKPGLDKDLRDRCKQNALRVQTDAPQTLVVFLNYPPCGFEGLQLDVWIARPAEFDLLETRPSNFGALLITRTGSKEHNIKLVEHAKKLGLRWHPYQGVLDSNGRCLASNTEEEIFHSLQLPYIPPERREA